MGRRPKSDTDVHLTIGDTVVTVATSTMQTLNAKGFIAACMGRGISAAVAGLYARTAARSIRAGRAYQPDLITTGAERTAVRAYWRWATDAYARRVSPVRRKLLLDAKQVARLRCSSIVPPGPDKQVPKVVAAPEVRFDHVNRRSQYIPARIEWVPSNTWTLHIPTADTTPVHKDPCTECMMHELTTEQVEVVAAAFEDAWGHRDLARMPPEALLFGPQPPDAGVAPRKFTDVGRIVALTTANTAIADSLVPLRGVLTESRESFVSLIGTKRTRHLVISRDADPELFAHVLAAIGAVDTTVEEAPLDEQLPVPPPAPPLPAPAWQTGDTAAAPDPAPTPVLTLVPPIESGPMTVPEALRPPADTPPDDWSFVKPDQGPPVPPEVAAQLSSSWWARSSAEFRAKFPHLQPPEK